MRPFQLALLLLLAAIVQGCGRSESKVDQALNDLDAPAGGSGKGVQAELDAMRVLSDLQPGDEFAYGVLVKHIEADREYSSPLAITTLTRVAPTEYVIPVLIKALDSKRDIVAASAAAHLGKIGREASKALEKLLGLRLKFYRKDNVAGATTVEEAIASIDAAKVPPRMYQGPLGTKEWKTMHEWLTKIDADWPTGAEYLLASEAVKLVRRVGTDQQTQVAISHLGKKVMKGRDAGIRYLAASLLGDLAERGEPAIPVLEYARDYDADEGVRKQAGESIGAIKYAIANAPVDDK